MPAAVVIHSSDPNVPGWHAAPCYRLSPHQLRVLSPSATPVLSLAWAAVAHRATVTGPLHPRVREAYWHHPENTAKASLAA